MCLCRTTYFDPFLFVLTECSQRPKDRSSNDDLPNRPPSIRTRSDGASSSGVGSSSSQVGSSSYPGGSSRVGSSSHARAFSPQGGASFPHGSESSPPESPLSIDSESSLGSPKYLVDPLKAELYDFPVDHNLTYEEKKGNLRIHHRIEPHIEQMVAVNKHGDIYGAVDLQGDVCRIYQNDERKVVNKNTHTIRPFEGAFKPARRPQ